MPRSKATAKQAKDKVVELTELKKKFITQKIARKSAPVTTGVKQSKRSKPGRNALRQIKKYQKSTEMLIQRAPFQRKIRQIALRIKTDFSDVNELNRTEANSMVRFQPSALLALQQGLEAAVISLLQDASLCSHHARRITLMGSDILLARRIRGNGF